MHFYCRILWVGCAQILCIFTAAFYGLDAQILCIFLRRILWVGCAQILCSFTVVFNGLDALRSYAFLLPYSMGGMLRSYAFLLPYSMGGMLRSDVFLLPYSANRIPMTANVFSGTEVYEYGP
jgi:hypothetical protein